MAGADAVQIAALHGPRRRTLLLDEAPFPGLRGRGPADAGEVGRKWLRRGPGLLFQPTLAPRGFPPLDAPVGQDPGTRLKPAIVLGSSRPGALMSGATRGSFGTRKDRGGPIGPCSLRRASEQPQLPGL